MIVLIEVYQYHWLKIYYLVYRYICDDREKIDEVVVHAYVYINIENRQRTREKSEMPVYT